MNHELIELTKFLSMPAPFSSAKPGEAWVCGDFVAILQMSPKKVADVVSAATGEAVGPIPMEYPFALTVFYRKDRNPHGPSSRPIAVATLEQADYRAFLKQLGPQNPLAKAISLNSSARTVKGLFTPEGHINYGEYEGALTLDAVREQLFGLVRSHLALTGEPVKIGTIQDVYGHPDTGWPAQPLKKGGFGCLVLFAAMCAFVFYMGWRCFLLGKLV